MNRMVKNGVFALLLAFSICQSSDVKAFSGSCTDFNLSAFLDGPDSVQSGVPVSFTGEVGTFLYGGSGPVTASIWFGDGGQDSARTNGDYLPFGFDHTYAASGPYNVEAIFTGRDPYGHLVACSIPYTIYP